MTNLRKIFGLITISSLVFLAAGCEKDDETRTSAFTIAGGTTYDFEYSQTKSISYNSTRIDKYSVTEVPEGWTCTHSGGKFVITSPSEADVAAGDKAGGTIKVSATTETGNNITRDINVNIRIAEQIDGQANCIVVTEPGKRYKFRALSRGNETAETLRADAAGAIRLWSTSETAIVNVSLEEGQIYFATEDAETLVEANAVVAVTDKDGAVLWSWHIWASVETPGAVTYDLDGKKVMDRNLGAFAASDASPEDALRSYGLYYQWGRKDPFVGPNAWNSNTGQALYDSTNKYIVHTYAVSDSDKGTVEYSVANPGQFIAGAEDNGYDWLFAAHDNGLWSADRKTLYDPCPKGWRVAPPTIWTDFTTTGRVSENPDEFNVVNDGDYIYGWIFDAAVSAGVEPEPATGGIFFPAAGRRSFSPSLASSAQNFTNVVNNGDGVGLPVGFYWSSLAPSSDAASTAEQYGAASLAFTKDRIAPVGPALSENARAGGFPVRCMVDAE